VMFNPLRYNDNFQPQIAPDFFRGAILREKNAITTRGSPESPAT